jgi:hypothetical protein
MKKYKFLILSCFILCLFTGCNRNNDTNVNIPNDNDGVDVDVPVSVNVEPHSDVTSVSGNIENNSNENNVSFESGDVNINQEIVDNINNINVYVGESLTGINENNGMQTIINSCDVCIDQGVYDNILNNDTNNTTTTGTTQQNSNSSTSISNNNTSSTLHNDDVELIVHGSNSCTGHISNDYITKYYIGRKSGDFKTIGWSIYMKTDTDSMAIAVEIDWEDETSENLRAVGIYQDEGTIQNGIDFNITDEGLFIELNSSNLPFDLYEVNYIEIRDISEII